MSRNGIVSLLSSTVPPQGISLVGEVPGALMMATAAQAVLLRVNSTLIDIASQPAFGHTRSGLGRMSIARPGSARSTTDFILACSCAAIWLFSSAIVAGMMRGHSTTTPPATPLECEIFSSRKRESSRPPATTPGVGPGVVLVLV